MTGFWEKFEKHMKEEYVVTYRGKKLNNSEGYFFEFSIMLSLVMLGGLFGWIIYHNQISPIAEAYDVCHAAVPDGYHTVSWSKNQTCTFSDGVHILKSKYLYDSIEGKYVLYKEE